MHRKHPIRLAGAALAAVMLALAVPGRADASVDIDNVKLTDPKIDFGSDDWNGLFDEPWGAARVYWQIVDGFYTPHIVGWLHLNNAAYDYGRVYVEYFDGGGNDVREQYSASEYVWNDDHHVFAVDLQPHPDTQIVKVRICTELSDDGASFDLVDCKIRDMN